jgi:hypothetical protein
MMTSSYYNLMARNTPIDPSPERDKNEEIVIAMDCFRGNRPDSLMVKKLAIYNVTTGGQGSFHFFPQHPWSDLHDVAKQANSFATRYIHNHRYYSGNITYDQLPVILSEHTDNASTIYAKGCSNVKFLTELIGRPVINIELLMKQIPRESIEYLKDHLPESICLDNHKRIYKTPGFESENYSCASDRAHFWGQVVKLFKEQQREELSSSTCPGFLESAGINTENEYY